MKTKLLVLLLIISSLCFVNAQQNIFDACRKGDLELVKSLYNKDANSINSEDKNGYTPLVLACYYAQEAVVFFLADKVNNINGRVAYGSPLMAAVVKNNYTISKRLLALNANTDISDANGTTALHYAVMFKYYDLVDLLVNANADINIKDKQGKSPLDFALTMQDKKLIDMLNKTIK